MGMEVYYVYKVTDPVTGEYYIGSKTHKGSFDPEDDSDYMGSYKKWEPEDENRLEKEIIKSFRNRRSAYKLEHDLIKQKVKEEKDKKCMNKFPFFHQKGKNHPSYGKTGSESSTAIPVNCECHNKEFESIKECAEFHDLKSGFISRRLKKRERFYRPLSFD